MGVRNVAALSAGADYPTLALAPYTLQSAIVDVLSIAAECPKYSEMLCAAERDESSQPIRHILQRMISRKDLWCAAACGDLTMVQYFVRQMQATAASGGDFNIDALSPSGRSALYLAALGGHKATGRWLIDQGASDLEGAACLACTDPQTRKFLG